MSTASYYKCIHDKSNFYNVICKHTYESCLADKQERTNFCVQANFLTVPDLVIRYNIANRLTVTVHNPPTNQLTHAEAVGYST